MIGSSRASKQAEQFAALVDGRPTGREPSAEFLAFARVVSSLRDVEPVEMRPDFADGLRDRLMLEAPQRLAELAVPTAGDSGRALGARTPPRIRMARIAAVTCLVVGVTGGVAAASQSALPGDPLYGVKRGIEWVQVTLSGSDATEGQRLVGQASTRLDEISDLALTRPDDAATTRLIEQNLADFTDQANDGAGALITSYETDSNQDSIVRLRDFTDTSASELDNLGALIPAPARDELLDAARALSNLDKDARDACADCSSLAPLGVSDTVKDLASTAKTLLDLPPAAIPDNDPGADPGSTAGPGQRDPAGNLPTQGLPSGLVPSLPAQTQAPPNNGAVPIKPGATSLPRPSGGQGSTAPPLLPDLPLPDLPTPSLPLLDDLLG